MPAPTAQRGTSTESTATPLGHRRCLECDRASKRKYKQRIKAEKAVNQGGAR